MRRLTLKQPLSKEREKALRQEWRTPLELVVSITRRYGPIHIDVAASAENAIRPYFIDKRQDAFKAPWFDTSHGVTVAFCNPGFRHMAPWMHRAYSQVLHHPKGIAIVLGLCAPSTKWFRFAYDHAAEIALLSPRPQYIAPSGISQTSNPREGAVFVFRGSHIVTPETRAYTWLWNWKEER